jgi:hypothetical protein
VTDGHAGAPSRIYLRVCGGGGVTEAAWEGPSDAGRDALLVWLEPLTGASVASALADAMTDFTGPPQPER